MKDIDKIGRDKWDLENEVCYIDGEEYPLFYAKIINKVKDNEMPFILFLGKSGTGKTYASAKLGYDLTEKLGLYDGDFVPDENIQYQNEEYFDKALELIQPDAPDKIIMKPDINTTLNVTNHHDDANRAFENFVHLMRIFGNLMMGDGQLLWRMDSAIQETHTFRLVASGKPNEYAFDVYYIDRRPDSDNKEVEKKFIQRWRPDLPPDDLRKYIRDKDVSSKREILENAVAEMKGEDDDDDFSVA